MKQHTDHKTSPFDLISEREAEEEKRLQAAMERLRMEEMDKEKVLMEAEAVAEEQYREQINKELLAQKDAIGKEMGKAEKEMEKELEKIEALYKERAPKVIAEEVKTVLSLSL